MSHVQLKFHKKCVLARSAAARPCTEPAIKALASATAASKMPSCNSAEIQAGHALSKADSCHSYCGHHTLGTANAHTYGVADVAQVVPSLLQIQWCTLLHLDRKVAATLDTTCLFSQSPLFFTASRTMTAVMTPSALAHPVLSAPHAQVGRTPCSALLHVRMTYRGI